jgi:hypothetical protein
VNPTLDPRWRAIQLAKPKVIQLLIFTIDRITDRFTAALTYLVD